MDCMASIACEDCGAEAETATDLGRESVREITVDDSEGPPSVSYGADERDLFLCEQCGKVLGVN